MRVYAWVKPPGGEKYRRAGLLLSHIPELFGVSAEQFAELDADPTVEVEWAPSTPEPRFRGDGSLKD